MKVFFLTEGGKNIGFGHLTRCIALYQAFEERGIIPKFIVNGDKAAISLLKDKECKVFNWLNEKEVLFNLVKDTDIAVIDSYLADLSLYKEFSEIIDNPVYIDDNKRLDYPKGIVVNGSIYAEDLDYPEKENLTYLLGIQYAFLRKEFWNAPKKHIKHKIESIMVTFGGVDSANMTSYVLRFLNNKYSNILKNVVVTQGFQNLREIEDAKNSSTNLIYDPDAKRMREIMIESDLAILAGGQTLYELGRIGVPSVGICIAENQRKNLEKWEEVGFIEYIRRHNDDNLSEKLTKGLEKIFSHEERSKRNSVGRSLVDGKGATRIVRALLS